MSVLKNVVRFAVLAYLIVFAYFNSESVRVVLYPGQEQTIPLILLAVAAIAIGVAVMYLTMIVDQFRLKGELKKKNRRLQQLETEIRKLKEVTVEKIPVDIPKGHAEHADKVEEQTRS